MASVALSRSSSADTWRGRLAEFQAFTVAHPRLVAAKDELITAIRESEPNSIVMVFGPTGVGKTTLRMRAEQVLIEELRPELKSIDRASPWRVSKQSRPTWAVFVGAATSRGCSRK